MAPELLWSVAASPQGGCCAGEDVMRGEGFGNRAVSELTGGVLWAVVEWLETGLFA